MGEPRGMPHMREAWTPRTRWKRSMQRLIEIAAMSQQPGGVKRAIARMRAGDAVARRTEKWVG